MQYFTLCKLCFVFIQHTWCKKYESDTFNVSCIETGFQELLLHSQQECKAVTMDYLNAVAQIRFGLHLAATCLIREVDCNEKKDVVMKDSDTCSTLLMIVERICSDTTINWIDQVHATGPLMYLLRLLVRRYGMMHLKKIAKRYQWIQPPHLELTTEVSKPC